MKLSKTTTALLVAIGIIGAGSAAFATSAQLQPKSNSEVTLAVQSKINLTQAIQIASQQVQGDIVSAEFDDDKGGQYEVEIINGTTSHEIKINANTGEIIKTKQEVMDAEDTEEHKAFVQAKIKLNQAMQQANQLIGGQVVSAEFDMKKGVAVYDIEIAKDGQMHEVRLDANTGAVLKNKIDHDS